MRYVFIMVVTLLLFSGCADAVSFSEAETHESVGFWSGLWHGAIIIISFVLSLLDDTVAIYAIYNNGGWYDLGYLLGLMMTLGGSQQTYCYKKRIRCSDDSKRTKIIIDVESVDKA